MTRQQPSNQTSRSPRVLTQVAQRLLIGCAGGVVGAFAMNVFGRALNTSSNGREASGAAPGDDRVGRGVQPPQADGRADDDATVRVGTVAYRTLTESEPSPATRSWLGTIVHYAFGATMGACYTLVAERFPAVRMGHGTVYGTAVWIVADETIMPALGLSRSPRQLTPGVHAYALTGHWVYGVALESIARLATPRSSSHP